MHLFVGSKKFLAICISLVLYIWPVTVNCQGVFDEDELVFYHVALNGQLKRAAIWTRKPKPAFVAVTFLKDEIVRKEIALTGAQAKSLDKIIKAIESEQKYYIQRIRSAKIENPASENLATIEQQYKELIAEKEEEIRKLLFERQLVRLKEIAIWYEVRRSGLLTMMVRNKIPDVQLSLPAMRKISARGKELAVQLSDEMLANRKKRVALLLDQLKISQREQLREIVGDQEYLPNLSLELFVFQLAAMENEQRPKTSDDIFEKLTDFPVFEIGIDGGLRKHYPPKQYELAKPMGLAVGMLTLSTDPYLRERMVLSGEQIKELQQLRNTCREKHRQISKKYGERDKLTKELMAQIRGEQQQLWEMCVEDMKSVFLPHQVDQLVEIYPRVEFLRHGIVYSLVHGEIGKQLDITDAQKTKLKNSARKLQKEIMKTARETERTTIDALLDSLDDEERNKIKDLLGEPLEHSCPNMTLLIADLKGKLLN